MKNSQAFGLAQLINLLASDDGHLTIRASDRVSVDVTAEERRELAVALSELVARVSQRGADDLSSQEVADYLGVSRPTLIKLSESIGVEPKRVGRHRRFTLEDVLRIEESLGVSRRTPFDELIADQQEAGDYARHVAEVLAD